MVRVAIVTHEKRDGVLESARKVISQLEAAGITVAWVDAESLTDQLSSNNETFEAPVDLILVIGGDGTILRAAELAHDNSTPILGINYGHVGFLAEADPSGLDDVIQSIALGEWTVDSRMTVNVVVQSPDGHEIHGWALNEASIEKGTFTRMIEVRIGIDGRPLSSFKADTILVSTPTGSTAYNFSAGGPVVWPDVEAMIVTPVAAHALFARPLVIGPQSTLTVDIYGDEANIWLDGRRMIEVEPGSRVTVTRSDARVNLARLTDTPFSGRLVAKFDLPVQGWRSGGVHD